MIKEITSCNYLVVADIQMMTRKTRLDKKEDRQKHGRVKLLICIYGYFTDN